jgi:hypothetical protein
MQPYFTHTLEKDREEVLEHCPSEYLALVDLETYETFAGKEIDHLDMMAHLQNQMNALTAVAWGAPSKNLRVRLLLTEDQRALDRLAHSRHTTSASGWIRTSNGQLCFTSHERLFDCAHHRTHGLLREEGLPKNSRPHLLDVPPGIYSVQIYYHFSFPYGGEITHSVRLTEPKVHYTVILHHYAFPAPRLMPVRLAGGLIPWAGEEASIMAWGGRRTHFAGGE